MSSYTFGGHVLMIPDDVDEQGNKYPFDIPKIILDSVVEQYMPPKDVFSWSGKSLVVVTKSTVTKFYTEFYNELLITDEQGNTLWFDSREVPFDGSWKYKWSDVRGAVEYTVEVYDLDKSERRLYKATPQITPMTQEELAKVLQYLNCDTFPAEKGRVCMRPSDERESDDLDERYLFEMPGVIFEKSAAQDTLNNYSIVTMELENEEISVYTQSDDEYSLIVYQFVSEYKQETNQTTTCKFTLAETESLDDNSAYPVTVEKYQNIKRTELVGDFVLGEGELVGYKGEGGDVVLPDGITSIGKNAFNNCSSITSVVIPSGVTTIKEMAFANCSKLASVTIPPSVTRIDGGACQGCSTLTSIVIPNSVTTIEECMFQNCSSLVNVTLPSNLTTIKYSAFDSCSSLIGIDIPSGVTTIGLCAFSGCTSLTNINLPNSITSIGEDAFRGCALTCITIPASVTDIQYGLGGSSTCTQLHVDAHNPKYYSQNNCIIERDTNVLVSGSSASVIPQGVTAIGPDAFSDCTGLATVIIPDSVTSIGRRAFYGCTSLTSITIPKSVTSIEWWTFKDCTSLTEVELHDNVTIENSAFWGCSALKSITLPKNITQINDNTFDSCTSLASISIPNGVTSIGWQAFCGCTSLTEVTLPNSITKIDDYAFVRCDHLQKIIYAGTMAQWKAISTGEHWNYKASDFTIHCTDGEIAVKGTH